MEDRSVEQSCTLLHIYESERSKDFFLMHITWQTCTAMFGNIPSDFCRNTEGVGSIPTELFGKPLNDGEGGRFKTYLLS